MGDDAGPPQPASEQAQSVVDVCDVVALSDLGLRAIDRLARLQLEARRRGGRIALTNASPELGELIDLAGLRSVLPCLTSVELVVEVSGQAEQREEPRGVEEEGDPAEPVA
jgi:anti-anti-sigma regulatory factor